MKNFTFDETMFYRSEKVKSLINLGLTTCSVPKTNFANTFPWWTMHVA